jgi:hypothetical protein
MARRSLEQPETLQQRLEDEATRLREQAKLLEPGALRESLLRKARQTDTAAHMNEWLGSPGLQAPK